MGAGLLGAPLQLRAPPLSSASGSGRVKASILTPTSGDAPSSTGGGSFPGTFFGGIPFVDLS